MDLHEANSSPPPLDELAARIQSETDAFALLIGNLMDQGLRRNKAKFERWVLTSTPFSISEAHRLRAVFIAYRDLPAETVRDLPRPSSALSYVFDPVDTAPWMSPTNEFSREDLLAGALLGGHPENLGGDVRQHLCSWLGIASSSDAPTA